MWLDLYELDCDNTEVVARESKVRTQVTDS